MTAGRRVLLAVLQTITAREVALRVRVSPRAVSHWAAGVREPTVRHRATLEQHCGIPADLWDLSVIRTESGTIFRRRVRNTR